MQSPELIEVYNLPQAVNVCNQSLREVLSLQNLSLAHVTMDPGNISLLHEHLRIHEVYVILDGEGILYHGGNATQVERGACQLIRPGIHHKLKNIGKVPLEHLVIAIPPFNPADVHLVKDDTGDSLPVSPFAHGRSPIVALDGAIIHELMSDEERKELDVGLAIGVVGKRRKAIPHYHRLSDEVYYVIEGDGEVVVNGIAFGARKGSVVYVPRNAVHSLANTSASRNLSVLCVSSPLYSDKDFVLSQ